MKRAKQKPRKPGDIKLYDCVASIDDSGERCGIWIGDFTSEFVSVSECRRLAAWLVKAADYLDAKALVGSGK